MIRYLFLLYVLILTGCGGGGSSSANPPAPGPGQNSFWAVDFTTGSSYTVSATKVADGIHCYIYLENGRSVSQTAVDAIKNEFDTNIYPSDTTGFGAEPNPGIDNDPKIHILLLNIRDGFSPPANPTYIAGYFDSRNEYAAITFPFSNQKEILFVNINPATNAAPGSIDFYDTIAHEFQHMIHWEQKTHQRNLTDDTWLDEAMGTIARTYCGYGPDYQLVLTYENAPFHSLTEWDSTAANYGVVYMWAQYLRDRIDSATGNSIFRTMLNNEFTGISSVNAALGLTGYPKDFTETFRDWSIANYSGNTVSWPGHPEWSYTSIDTHPGTHDGITLPGLFPISRQNVSTLQPLDMWSVNYYWYTPAAPPTGSVSWNPAPPSNKAAFIDPGAGAITFDMVSGTTYGYTGTGYLIGQNPTGTAASSGDSVTHNSIAQILPGAVGSSYSTSPQGIMAKTPRQILEEANRSPLVRRLSAQTGKPHRICIDSFFFEREKSLRAGGARPPF